MNARDESYLNKKGFEFRDVIGAGGSGVVYRIYDPAYQCEFALKSIFRSKFNQSEIDIMNKLEDSNLVRLYNYEFYEDSVYLLMEYCPTSLHDNLRQMKRLSFEQLRKYSIGILKAVRACHSNKIAHKDIKPANFLIDQYDRIRLCDFGLSSILLDSALDQNFAGSVPFMAPEILMRKPHDAFKTDIWAVGVTFFIMATGMLPWAGKDRITLCNNLLSCSPCIEYIKDQNYASIVNACLSMDPAARPTVEQLLDLPIFKESTTLIVQKRNRNRYLAIAKNHIRAQSSMIIKPNLQDKGKNTFSR